MIVVTSWDDGHPADLKIASLLNQYGLAGTFFVPIRNIEGQPVLCGQDLRSIDKHHEIGSHTYSHRRLDSVNHKVAREEIVSGKSALEDILGHEVTGFCYPGGRITRDAIDCLQQANFSYARSIENFRLDVGNDVYRMPTTMHVSPHMKNVYVRNFIKRGNFIRRAYCFSRAMASDSVWTTLERIASERAAEPIVLHFWGHSWEIERLDLWGPLERFLEFVNSLNPVSLTAAQCIETLRNRTVVH